jgi:enoyl-CoA hydratase/carnithine racemase
MSYETIDYAVDEHILTITLSRPERLNAFTPKMAVEIIDAFGRADQDDDVRVVIVTGAGRAFCAGADLEAGAATFDFGDAESGGGEAAKFRDPAGMISLRIYRCLKPVIAAINGHAVGVGITMTLPMDIRMVSEDAKLGFIFARRGIVPEAGSAYFLPRVVGISTAMEWCATGRMVAASEALERRLVRSVHAAGDLMPAARSLAREIVENTAPVAVALARQMLWRGMAMDHPMEAHQLDSRMIQVLGQNADAAEGVQSFLDKRPASYPDKVSRDLPEFFPWWNEPEFD